MRVERSAVIADAAPVWGRIGVLPSAPHCSPTLTTTAQWRSSSRTTMAAVMAVGAARCAANAIGRRAAVPSAAAGAGRPAAVARVPLRQRQQ